MDTVNELVAGRELDKRIAEEVMGWTNIAKGSMSDDFFGVKPTTEGFMYRVPNYSQDVGHAMQIVEYLKTKQVYWGADNGWSGHQYGYTVEFEGDDVGNPNGIGSGDTLPMAICKSALAYMQTANKLGQGLKEAAKDFAAIALSDDTPEGQSEGSVDPTDH